MTGDCVDGSRRMGAEILIVLGLSLGQSAIYAIVRILDRVTRSEALASQTATLNPTLADRPWLDLVYQVLSIGFALVPVALALYLLGNRDRKGREVIGLNVRPSMRDLAQGAGLAALIGIPGIGVYLAGRALGITVEVQASGQTSHWWAVGILLAAALKNALLEEVIVVGYLTTRLRELRWAWPYVFMASAVLRGSYHLYQGFGMFVGNILMGLVFVEFYRRTQRVTPLIIAHFLIDAVAFSGYQWLPQSWLEVLGLA